MYMAEAASRHVSTGATGHGAGCACQHGRGRIYGGAARQRCPTQALSGALAVGGFDHSHLRGLFTAVRNVRWPNSVDWLRHWDRGDQWRH